LYVSRALDMRGRSPTLDREMQRPQHPYKNLPDRCFWRRAIQDKHPLDIGEWYRKKFEIAGSRIAAAGSCFAQHIGRHLRGSGYAFLDVEPPPPLLKPKNWLQYGYGMYSARYGNIYTTRQLIQLARMALGQFDPQDRAWPREQGFVDPFRPEIEPSPFATEEEVEISRKAHLAAVARLLQEAEVFIFTLGLTEGWQNVKDGAVLPLAPGVAGGEFDPETYVFRNFTFSEILQDLEEFFSLMRSLNSGMKFILTVSPVPLMATASAQQVAVATTYSKSILRAVAGELAAKYDYADYFPSFEIISSHVMNSMFYEADKRGVSRHGVEHVMKQFFSEHVPPSNRAAARKVEAVAEIDEDDVQCEEELLAGDR
jgi:hypothetical protein